MTLPSDTVSQGLERLLPTYARADVTFVRGDGARVWDAEGREYLDFGGGIAVVSLGHCHPAPLAAAKEQLELLWHASNLYRTLPAERLALALSERFGGAQAFFCNSGAEAIEAALKYARKATGKPGVVALDGSFHGRTLGALSATGQPAKREAFAPLVPGVRFVPPNDVAALRAAVDDEVGLVLLEPILGEGGVIPLDAEFVATASELAPLLALDEIQTGVGRTGTFFAFEQLGVTPDLVAMAKGLANGLPDRRPARRGRGRGRVRARRPRVHLRRQSRLVRSRLRRRRCDRRRAAGERPGPGNGADRRRGVDSRRDRRPRARPARGRRRRPSCGRRRHRLPRARPDRPQRGRERRPARAAADHRRQRGRGSAGDPDRGAPQ